MHTMISMILRAYLMVLHPTAVQMPAMLTSDECGGAKIGQNADCAVLVGDSCQNECFKQDSTVSCEAQCGLQNCHDYSCYEWRCVADCTDAKISACIKGCGAEGTLFCDSKVIVSGSDVSACVDYLCEKNIEVEGETCY